MNKPRAGVPVRVPPETVGRILPQRRGEPGIRPGITDSSGTITISAPRPEARDGIRR
jgi:hypothetical protein